MLRATPITFKQANEYVAGYHRHHKPVIGCKFVIGVSSDAGICGVAITGRPVARGYDSAKIVEVNRLCTDGTKNACSFLYSTAARIAKELGYESIITYILASESGISLLASGWEIDGRVKGRSWDCESRPRTDKHPTEDKVRYIKKLNKPIIKVESVAA